MKTAQRSFCSKSQQSILASVPLHQPTVLSAPSSVSRDDLANSCRLIRHHENYEKNIFRRSKKNSRLRKGNKNASNNCRVKAWNPSGVPLAPTKNREKGINCRTLLSFSLV